MNKIKILGVVGALAGLSACGPGAIESFQTDSLYSRSMAMQTNGVGEATGVVDRSNNEGTMVVRQRSLNNVLVDGGATVNGAMAFGTTVPGDDGLPLDPTSISDYIATYENADSFLGTLQEGANYSTVLYATDLGDRRYTTYGVTKGHEATNMPNSGTATYNGNVNGTVFGSQTGEQQLSGNVSMGANFGPGIATIGGKMTNLRLQQGPDNFALGSEIVMNATPITGNNYRNGTLQFVTPGTNTANAVMASSAYDGAFYGNGGPETAGTFQFDALGAPISGGGTERIQGVGAYGAAR
jgi:hypothetical protein